MKTLKARIESDVKCEKTNGKVLAEALKGVTKLFQEAGDGQVVI